MVPHISGLVSSKAKGGYVVEAPPYGVPCPSQEAQALLAPTYYR